MSSRIFYHVRKEPAEVTLTKNDLEKVINDCKESLSNCQDFLEMTDDILIEYILNTVKNKIKYYKAELSHTLMFEYNIESDILFVTWAKPRHSIYEEIYETFSKSRAFEIVNKRMNRLISYVNGDKVSCGGDYSEIPDIISKSIEKHLPKVRKYFKGMPEDVEIRIY